MTTNKPPRLFPLLQLCRLMLASASVVTVFGVLAALRAAHAAVLPPLVADKALVATDHHLASLAGIQILQRGGNAVDAACPAAFALGVVNPAGSGVGGGGFMLIHRPGTPEPTIIDFRETAPAAAHEKMFAQAPAGASRDGGLAVGVPGEVLGCSEAVRRFGKLSLRRVLRPAIKLAREGFIVAHHLSASVRRSQDRLSQRPLLSKTFFVRGEPVSSGHRLKRPRLAQALAAIASQGPSVFYRGWIAQDIIAAVKRAGGVLTAKDLAQYRVKQRKPLVAKYRGYRVFTMPPPSSGGVAMVTVLQMLRRWKLAPLGHNSSAYLHRLAETFKHAFADRARFLGDTDFVSVPLKRLTSVKYADTLARRIGERVGSIEAYGSPAPPRAAPRDSGTSHLSVVDAQRMAVALTTTINTAFGSMVVAPRSGILLNNQMDDFSARPGRPNAFGLTQSRLNAVAAGKRPLSSMAPTIVTRNGEAELVLGASGGPWIITSTLQVLLNVLDFGLDVRQAVSRSRIHHQWLPDKLRVESDLPEDVQAGLRRRGHRVALIASPFSAVQAVQVGRDDISGASDPRKMGEPAGL